MEAGGTEEGERVAVHTDPRTGGWGAGQKEELHEGRRRQADKQASRQKTAAERYRRSYLEELLGHQCPAHGAAMTGDGGRGAAMQGFWVRPANVSRATRRSRANLQPSHSSIPRDLTPRDNTHFAAAHCKPRRMHNTETMDGPSHQRTVGGGEDGWRC